MSGPLLKTPAVVFCPHGAPVLGLRPSGGVMGRGGGFADIRAFGSIAGCPSKPPCATAVWRRGLNGVRSRGAALLDCATPGECLNAAGASQGPTRATPTQISVRGR